MNGSKLNWKRGSLSVLCVAMLGSAAWAAGDPPEFDVVSLEPFGTEFVTASALNDAGQVTGVVLLGPSNKFFPFLWSTTTGRVVMPTPAGHTAASAEGINAQGDIVGFIVHPLYGHRGYRWVTGPSFERPVRIFPQLQNRLPLAIGDDRRTVVGQGYDADDPAWVFDVVTGVVTDLQVGPTVIPGVNQATSVNAAGHVVGTISTVLPNGNVQPRAFRYSPGFAGWFIELLPGPNSPWFWTDASDINDSGDVVGFVMDLDDQSAAHWNITSDFTDLGIASPQELVTIAKAVNEKGWIVGWSPNDHPLGLDTPFVWIDGTFYDLNDLVDLTPGPGGEDAGVVYRAHDINNSGVILAEIVHFSPALRFEDVLLVPKP